MVRALFVLLSICGLAWPQNGSQLLDWRPPASEGAGLAPKLACADLRSLTGYEFTVATATLVAGTGDTPEHCRISGQVLPEVRFEVNLPAAWNRRLYMFGNGGFAGESFDSPPRVAHRARALGHGFAVASTNTGHDASVEPLATFAADRQKLYDYAFRSLHVTAETAKKLIRAYYGTPHSRAYFDGCSTGGRQGLILSQRFPEDFDGIVVGAPVLNFSGTMVSYAWIAQALADGNIPMAKMGLLAERVYAHCDATDGLKDGLIEDPRRCGFAPSRHLPKCAGTTDQPSCFTGPQIAALEKIYADVVGRGKRLFPGWPAGAEIAGSNGRTGWDRWIIAETGRTISVNFAESFFRHMGFPEQKPDFALHQLDFDKDPGRLQEISGVLDATDPDLTRFRDRGSKIVMYYGWADQALNARMGVEYYERVQEQMGASPSGFFRLFMVPGMFHCRGGVGTDTFDALSPLIRWVEQGAAPESIPAARLLDGKTVRTRPLCPYPEVAKYKGTGSIDDAASFTCAKP